MKGSFHEARAEREARGRVDREARGRLRLPSQKTSSVQKIFVRNTQRIQYVKHAPVIVFGCTIGVEEQSAKTLVEEARKVRLQLARAQKDLRELWLERDELDAMAKRAAEVGGSMKPSMLYTYIY